MLSKFQAVVCCAVLCCAVLCNMDTREQALPHVWKKYCFVQRQKIEHKGEQEERIDCVCGVTADTPAAEHYAGLWLQCDECLSWLHGDCVGYPKRAPKGALSAASLSHVPWRKVSICLLYCTDMATWQDFFFWES